MMMNLFSIFDPSSYILFKLNWISLSLIYISTTFTFWVISSKKSLIMNKILCSLSQEMKMLLSNKSMGKTMFFMSLIVFILMNNFLGLYPYIFTYSSHMSMTLALAIPAWLASILFGWTQKTNNMLAHMIPASTSGVLMPFMACIELVSITIRPLTLAIRLATNMIAGHLLLVLLSDQNYFTFSPYLKGMVVLIQILLLSLEAGVALVQSYVFSTLSLLYASEAN